MGEPNETIESLRRTVESLKGENDAPRHQIGAIRESEDRLGKGRTTESDYLGQHIVTRRSIIASGLVERMARVLEGVPFETDEVHFPALSGGGEGYFNIRGVPLTRNGEIIGAIFMSIDVTALRRTKDELRHHKERLEAYLSAHSEIEFSHSLCPECARKLYPELLTGP